MSTLAIQLLGEFCLTCDGKPVTTVASPRLQSLLAYLILHRTAAQPRQRLAFLFWPDSPEADARNNLRQLLFELPHAVPNINHFLDIQATTLRWRDDAPFTCDVDDFKRAVADANGTSDPRAALESAAALYCGDMLPGCYDDWIAPEREHLRDQCVAALERLIHVLTEQHDLTAAIGYAQRQLRLDPVHEAAYRQLMRLHAASGDRAGVVRVYHACVAILSQELAVEPNAETQELYERSLNGSISTGSAGRSSLSTSIDSSKPQLPVQLTGFVGRGEELAQIRQLLDASRLVTLTGAGGCGKTRLAVEAAASLFKDFKDGVWFADLAPLTDAELIPSTLAGVFGIEEQSGHAILNLLKHYLSARKLLLVLDNCEHLIDTCASIADSLLRAAPQLKLLVTSREPLAIAGEQLYRVPPLQLPQAHAAVPLTAMAQVESIRLFVERARAVQPKFRLTAENADTLVQICCRLDGMPLAIELAAAQVRALSVEAIADRLDDRFRLVSSGSRTTPPRHQTLQATIDWSYHLLTEAERLLLHRLAVFAGGWTLSAAEAICADEKLPRADIYECITHLIDKSLVLLEVSGTASEGRYRILETIRQYAREKLMASGEGAVLRHRHLAHFVQWAEAVEPKLKGAEQLNWLQELERERDNLRTALEWSVDSNVETGLRLANALVWFWWLHMYWREGWGWLERLLARSDSSMSAARARALSRGAHLLTFLNEPARAEGLAQQALALSQSNDDQPGIADGLFYMGLACYVQDKSSYLEFFEDSLALFRELGDRWSTALALFHFASALRLLGQDLERVFNLNQESLTLFRECGDRWGQSFTLRNLGFIWRMKGDYARARACFQEAMHLAAELGHKLQVARNLRGLGHVAFLCGEFGEAIEHYQAGVKVHQDFNIQVEYGEPLLGLGLATLHTGDLVTAWCLLAEALDWSLQGSPARYAAYCLAGLAAVYLARQQPDRAVRLFACVDASLESDYGIATQVIRVEVERNLAAAREQLGETEFSSAWALGCAMTIGQAIAYALDKP